MSVRRSIAALSLAAAMLMAAAPTSSAAEDPATGADNPVASETVIATYHGKKINLSEGWPQDATSCTEVAAGDVRCYDSSEEELKDLADESLGHAVAAETKGMKVAGALDTNGFRPKPLRDAHESSVVPSSQSAGTAEADFGTMSISDCYAGYVCLYDYTSYSGRILRWSASGTKTLSDWSFRDRAGSACNNDGTGAHVSDWRVSWDPELYLGWGYCYKFTNADYTYGGDWNNKADTITLH